METKEYFEKGDGFFRIPPSPFSQRVTIYFSILPAKK